MERDFKFFVEKYSEAGARSMFEKTCHRLLQAKFDKNVHMVRQNPGDGGVDTFRGNYEEPIDVFQCKFFMGKIDYGQIKNSFRKAMDNKSFIVKSWTLCLPKVLDEKELVQWSRWKKEREKEHSIKIYLMDGQNIINEMKNYNIYNSEFGIDSINLLSALYSMNKEDEDSKVKEKMNSIITKVLFYIESRIKVFKELYENCYDTRHFFRLNRIATFRELFIVNKSDEQFHLFRSIETLIKEIEEHDAHLAEKLKRYILNEKQSINDIQRSLNQSVFEFWIQSKKTFEVNLLQIISELEKESREIKSTILETYSNVIVSRETSRVDLNDRIVVYTKEKLELLAFHVLVERYKNTLEMFEIFYEENADKCLNFGLLFTSFLYFNIRTPNSPSADKLYEYIDKNHSKINNFGVYSHALHASNIIFLEELESRTIRKLRKIKNLGNVRFHYFVQEDRVEKFIIDNKIDKTNITMITINNYDEYRFLFQKDVQLLLNNLVALKSSVLKTVKLYDGSSVTTDGFSFSIRKPKQY